MLEFRTDRKLLAFSQLFKLMSRISLYLSDIWQFHYNTSSYPGLHLSDMFYIL